MIEASEYDVELSRTTVVGSDDDSVSELEGAVDALRNVGVESGDVEGDISTVLLLEATVRAGE